MRERTQTHTGGSTQTETARESSGVIMDGIGSSTSLEKKKAHSGQEEVLDLPAEPYYDGSGTVDDVIEIKKDSLV